jgi:hypothetical protein
MDAILEDSFMLMWHIDPLLGNDRETNNETRDVVKQRPALEVLLEAVFPVWPAPRLCHAIDRVQFS